MPSARGEIEGHTDDLGSLTYNQKLSEERAEAVKSYVVSKGVDPSRVSAKGFGKSEPIAENGTEEGRARNRRVLFKRIDPRQ
jgi:OOP family OmpA-OmpF porin